MSKWVVNKEPQKDGYIIWEAGVGEIACIPYNLTYTSSMQKAETAAHRIVKAHNKAIGEEN